MAKSKEIKMVTGMATIKMTNRAFLNKFYPSFLELTKLPSNTKSGKIKYAVKRSLGSVQDALDKYTSVKQEIFEERAKLDESGNPVMGQDNSYIFESKEIRKEAIDTVKELDNKEIELTVYPITKENLIASVGSISIGMELNLEGFVLIENEELVE